MRRGSGEGITDWEKQIEGYRRELTISHGLIQNEKLKLSEVMGIKSRMETLRKRIQALTSKINKKNQLKLKI